MHSMICAHERLLVIRVINFDLVTAHTLCFIEPPCKTCKHLRRPVHVICVAAAAAAAVAAAVATPDSSDVFSADSSVGNILMTATMMMEICSQRSVKHSTLHAVAVSSIRAAS